MIAQVHLNDVLLQAAKEVFETMIFMEIEKCTQPEQQIQDDALLGSITFSGNLEGCLAICCGQVCGKTIAANMLGMDGSEELSREDIKDAIGEVANMVMGSVKARLPEDVGQINVSIPTVVTGRELQNSLGASTSKAAIKVNIEDEYIAELSLLYRNSSK